MDLNNLGHFMKFPYLSHMRKVKVKNTCEAICTMPDGVRRLKFGLNGLPQDGVNEYVYIRVPTSSGNHGKPGKSLKNVPCIEKSWNLKEPE